MCPPQPAPAPEEFHVPFTCSPGLHPRNDTFRVSLLVSPRWFARPELACVPLLICFSGGDAKQSCTWTEIREPVSLVDIIDVQMVDPQVLCSRTSEERDTLLLVLDRALVACVNVGFSAGDKEDHRIVIPRDTRARICHPIETLLATLTFARTRRTLNLHFPRAELREFFTWQESPARCMA